MNLNAFEIKCMWRASTYLWMLPSGAEFLGLCTDLICQIGTQEETVQSARCSCGELSALNGITKLRN